MKTFNYFYLRTILVLLSLIFLSQLETPISSHNDEMNALLPTSYVRGTMSIGTVGWNDSGNLNFLIMAVENENKCRYLYENFNFRRSIQKCAETVHKNSGFSQVYDSFIV